MQTTSSYQTYPVTITQDQLRRLGAPTDLLRAVYELSLDGALTIETVQVHSRLVLMNGPLAPYEQWMQITGVLGTIHVIDDGSGCAQAGRGGRAQTGKSGIARVGRWGTAVAGDFGVAIAGAEGCALAGRGGIARVGASGKASTGLHGSSTAGSHGKAISGAYGIARVGQEGLAVTGMYGCAYAGLRGTASAGYQGSIHIQWYDTVTRRHRWAIGYVGEYGIEADVPYRCDGQGRLVRVRED